MVSELFQKLSFANLCKPVHDVPSDPLNLEIREKKLQKIEYLENEKSFLDEINKSFTITFEILSSGKI